MNRADRFLDRCVAGAEKFLIWIFALTPIPLHVPRVPRKKIACACADCERAAWKA